MTAAQNRPSDTVGAKAVLLSVCRGASAREAAEPAFHAPPAARRSESAGSAKVAKFALSQFACALCSVKEQGLCRAVPARDLSRLLGESRHVHVRPAGTALFEQGGACEHVFIIQTGWVAVYKLFEDGRRQVMRFAMPGDLLGFEGDDTVGMLYTAEALTEVTVCAIRRGAVGRACQTAPRLALNMTRAMAHEALAAWNHLGALGQQTAQERIANLLLELYRRVLAQQRHPEPAVRIPLNQVLIADATGLTPVHVCRTLKRMRLAGLLDFTRGELMILDSQRLQAIAELDPDVMPVDVAKPGVADESAFARLQA